MVLVGAAVLGGCGSGSAPSPTDIAQSYMKAVAEGNYSSACSMITAPARRTLSTAVDPRHGCVAILHRCIPVNPLKRGRDQQQLLFAEVLPTVKGDRASVAVSGTEVARELRRLTMTREKSGWKITGPGRVLNRCRAKRRRRSRPGRH